MTVIETFADAVRALDGAPDPVTLFGPCDAHDARPTAAARRRYHQLARLVHPDQHVGADAQRATTAFAALATLWSAYCEPTSTRPHPAPGAPSATRSTTPIVTRRATIDLGRRVVYGDLANLYAGTRSVRDRRADAAAPEGLAQPVMVKMPRNPRDNDLLENEAAVLSHLAKEADPAYRAYLPQLVETFRHHDTATGTNRRVNVLAPLDGFRPLTDVVSAYPDGLDPRDVAWMWRRLLVALGTIHRAGVTHTAALPEHVLIHPAEHGLVLVDFAYATRGGPARALVGRYRDWYPVEVTAREEVGPGTDIAMATRCMTSLMGKRAPQPLRAFARGCTLTQLRHRPDDAWRLLGELDELLERLYGPRTFRTFHLPPPAAAGNTERPAS